MQKPNPNLMCARAHTHTLTLTVSMANRHLSRLHFCFLHEYGKSDLVICDHFMMWQELFTMAYESSAGML